MRERTLIYLLIISFFGYLLYSIKGIVAPFIIALIFAYLLNPLVEYLQKAKLSRTMSTIVAVLLLFALLAVLFIMIIPIILYQTTELISLLKSYKFLLNTDYKSVIAKKLDSLPPEAFDKVTNSLQDAPGHLATFTGNLLSNLFSSGVSVVNMLPLLLITPIITFYALRDWKKIVSSLKNLIPQRYQLESKGLLKDLDKALSGFLRGQTYVCLILSIFYAISLSLIGLETGFAIGALSGFLTFIPYVGPILCTLVATLTAALQFQSTAKILMVAGVFVFGQLVDGSFLTPKIIGDNVGLHPVWIIFGLLASAALLGFVGIIVAVPLTAAIGVVIRFIIAKYERSEFYKQK
jgi:predicted PurR-regulated permease PerM